MTLALTGSPPNTAAMVNAAVNTELSTNWAALALALAAPFRNRLHNGTFGVNQRSYVSGTALAAGVYAHDRWKAGAGGCTYTFTQAQPTTTITITAGTLQQVIESLSVEGGSYTLSWSGTATARVNAGSYLASPITVTGLAANTAITVEFGTGTVGLASCEPGAVANPFERRPFGFELFLCQRYYQTGAWQWQGYLAASSQFIMTVGLPCSMRASPTCTESTASATNLGTVACSSPPGTTSQVQIYATSGSAGSATGYGTFTASADL